MATVGVLSLQGAFEKHAEALRCLGASVVYVKEPKDLHLCDALIIPGGESTTMTRQIAFSNLHEPLHAFAKTKGVFGTCAGAILMSKKVLGDPMVPFGLIDMEIKRNAYGRQADSFLTNVDFQGNSCQAFFIRAPKIQSVASGVKVLATHGEEAVFVQQGKHLAATFHPELSDSLHIHSFFLNTAV